MTDTSTINTKKREVWWSIEIAKTEAALKAELAEIKSEFTDLRHSLKLYTPEEREAIRFCREVNFVINFMGRLVNTIR